MFIGFPDLGRRDGQGGVSPPPRTLRPGPCRFGAPLAGSQHPPASPGAVPAGPALLLPRRWLGHPGSTRSWPQLPQTEESTAGAIWQSRGGNTGPRRRESCDAESAAPSEVARPLLFCCAPAGTRNPRHLLLWPRRSLPTLGAAYDGPGAWTGDSASVPLKSPWP